MWSLLVCSSKKGGKSANKPDDEENEGLALLIPDIQETARLVHVAKQRLREISGRCQLELLFLFIKFVVCFVHCSGPAILLTTHLFEQSHFNKFVFMV